MDKNLDLVDFHVDTASGFPNFVVDGEDDLVNEFLNLLHFL